MSGRSQGPHHEEEPHRRCRGPGLVTALSACSSAGGTDGSSTRLNIGYIAGASAAIPDVIARGAGVLQGPRTGVQLVNTATGPGLVTLLLSGGVDISGRPPASYSRRPSRSRSWAATSAATPSNCSSARASATTPPPSRYPENLRGRRGARVGVSATGSYAQVLADADARVCGGRPVQGDLRGGRCRRHRPGCPEVQQIDLLVSSPVSSRARSRRVSPPRWSPRWTSPTSRRCPSRCTPSGKTPTPRRSTRPRAIMGRSQDAIGLGS